MRVKSYLVFHRARFCVQSRLTNGGAVLGVDSAVFCDYHRGWSSTQASQYPYRPAGCHSIPSVLARNRVQNKPQHQASEFLSLSGDWDIWVLGAAKGRAHGHLYTLHQRIVSPPLLGMLCSRRKGISKLSTCDQRDDNAVEHSQNPEFKERNSCQFPGKSEVVEQQSVLRILGDHKLF